MSLTGGYDLCIEIDRAVFRATAAPLLANPLVQRPTIPVAVSSRGRRYAGTLSLFVASFDITVVSTPEVGIRLTLRFDGSGLRLTGANNADESAVGLRGEIAVPIPVVLTGMDAGRSRDLVLDLGRAGDLAISFTDSARDEIALLCRRLDIDMADVVAALDQAVTGSTTTLLSAFGDQRPMAASFRLAGDDEEGALSPFRPVDLVLSTAHGRAPYFRNVLVLLGTLVRGNAGRGNPLLKTELALREDEHFSIVITPEAFRRAALCPQALRAFLPDWLQGHLPGDFLERLPTTAFERFVRAAPANERDQLRALLRQYAEDGEIAKFADRVLPDALPRNLLPFLGDEIAGALPAAVRAVLADTQAAVAGVLPPDCGRAAALPVQDAKIDRLEVRFLDGVLQIYGHVLPDRVGIEGHLDFWVDIQLSLQDGKITPNAGAPVIRSALYVAWWAVAASLGILTFIIAIIQNYANTRASGQARRLVINALSGLDAVNLPLPAGVTASAVEVTPDGLILRGGARSASLPAVALPDLAVIFSRSQQRRDLKDRTVAIRNDCVDGTFRVHTRQVQTRYTFRSEAQRITTPVRFEWTVAHHRVEGTGTLQSDQGKVLLNYAVRGDRLELWNAWEAPTLLVAIECRALGGDGTGAEAATSAYFDPPGEIYDERYGKAVGACVKSLLDDLDQLFATAPTGPLGRLRIDRDSLRRSLLAPGRAGTLDPLPLLEVAELSKRFNRNPAWLRDAVGPALTPASVARVVRRGPR